MNTTHHWREFASSLLSQEFLTLAKIHLAPGGIVIWNCTSSPRAARTGLEVFPHTMMCLNNCIGSLDPLVVDKARWRQVLTAYRIDGEPLFDLDRPAGALSSRACSPSAIANRRRPPMTSPVSAGGSSAASACSSSGPAPSRSPTTTSGTNTHKV